ncbi:MAG: tetratricopeptide repeat protein [Chitinivibrionales bacterium]
MEKFILIVLCLSASLLYSGDLLERGNHFYEEGMYDSSAHYYRKAANTGDRTAVAWFNLGNSKYHIRNKPGAVAAYRASVREAPEFFRARFNLGTLYYELGDLSKAVSHLKTSLSLKPGNRRVLVYLAAAYRELEAYHLAIPMAERAVQARSGENSDLYFMLYGMNRDIGDYSEAVYWMERYPDTGSRVSEKYSLLGAASERMDEPNKAMNHYRRVLRMEPGNTQAGYSLVRIMFEQGHTINAFMRAEEMLMDSPDFGQLALLAGNHTFKEGYYRKSAWFYLKASEAGLRGGYSGLNNAISMLREAGNTQLAQRYSEKLLGIRE